MRCALPIIEGRLIAATFALAGMAFGPAFAGEGSVDLDWLPGVRAPAETGKAAIVPPAARTPEQGESGSCVSALPCGTRLLGTVRRNGAVELQVPALRW
jgi:hypothetical protein